MLSFLRARSMRSSPLRPQSVDVQWSGRALTVRIDPARVVERVALDLDGSFFWEEPVGAAGVARFDFAFAPVARDEVGATLRSGRGGVPLAGHSTVARHLPGHTHRSRPATGPLRDPPRPAVQ